MKVIFMSVALVACCGCVGPIIYAPEARELTLYKHEQEASLMAIQQDIRPKVSEEMTGLVGAQVEGNSVLSPSVENVGNPSTKVGIK